jgi:glycosyltransferase involved in cell wall biosynthesis
MKISIITVVLNERSTITYTIESILAQSYKNIEYIIVDGGSNDGTLDIIAKFRSDIAQVISEPDRGMYDAMNKGICRATGDVIGTLNANDIYAHNGVIAKVVDFFKNGRIDSCYGDLVYIASKHINCIIRLWRSGFFNERRFFWGWMPPHPTFFVRRQIYEKYGLFNINLGSAADYELMLRFLLKHKITAAYLPEVVVKMRIGGMSNVSLKNRIHANRMDRMAWKVNGLKPYPWTIWMKPIRKLGQFFTHSYYHDSTVYLF